MKKILSVVLLLALTCGLVLTGCGSSEEKNKGLEGTTWRIMDASNAEGKKITEKQFDAIIGEVKYEFQSGGVLVATAAGKSVTGTWTIDNGEITITCDGIDTPVKLDGNKMTMANKGYTFNLEKQ